MWQAIKKESIWKIAGKKLALQYMRNIELNQDGNFPADLTYSDISSSCVVSPSITSTCRDSINNEIALRKKKDKKAQETKETQEKIQQSYDLLKDASSELERFDLQDQLNKLKEDITYVSNAGNEILAEYAEQENTEVEDGIRQDHIEL